MARGIVVAGCVLVVAVWMPSALTAQETFPAMPALTAEPPAARAEAPEATTPATVAPDNTTSNAAPAIEVTTAKEAVPAPVAAPTPETAATPVVVTTPEMAPATATETASTPAGVPTSAVEPSTNPAAAATPETITKTQEVQIVLLSGTVKAMKDAEENVTEADFVSTDDKVYTLKLDDKGLALAALGPATRVDIKGAVAKETDAAGKTVEVLTVTSFREHVRPITMIGTVKNARNAEGQIASIDFTTTAGNTYSVNIDAQGTALAAVAPDVKVQVRCIVVTETDENDKTVNKMTVLEFKEIKPVASPQ